MREYRLKFLCSGCLLLAALGLAGCAAAPEVQPELPAHPGAAWKSGGNTPVINSEEVTREGYVYEPVPPTPPLEELPRPSTEKEREAAFAKLRSSGKNNSSLKQSKAHLGDLRRQMNDMLKEKPQK